MGSKFCVILRSRQATKNLRSIEGAKILRNYKTGPVAVPCVRLGDGAPALHTDRGHSLRSLYPPQAALPSLPVEGAGPYEG